MNEACMTTKTSAHAAAAARAGVGSLWNREVGDLAPVPFTRRLCGWEALVMRFCIEKKLDEHGGCVNTVSFNSSGEILVSGSDDQTVKFWDWESETVKLSFHSGHSNNVFQARFMPYTNDRTLVTCAADGEVRLVKIPDNGDVQTTLLGHHDGRVHKLAIEPGSPYIFYSCGEDGVVQHFDLRTNSSVKLFICKSASNKSGPLINLNAIAIDPRNPNFFAVGGHDAYAQVYDIRKCKWNGSINDGNPASYFCPPHLIEDKSESVGISGLAYSHQSELLISYNNEHIYLFSKDQGLDTYNPGLIPSDKNTGLYGCQVYEGHENLETVKGASFVGPNCEYVASGSDCGRLFLWRKRDGKLLRAMDGDRYVVNCIESHPHSAVIASSGIEHDIKIWTPTARQAALPMNIQELKQHRRRNKYWSLTEETVRRIIALPRRESGAGDHIETFSDAAELMSYMRLVINGEGSSDDQEEGAGDCRVN